MKQNDTKTFWASILLLLAMVGCGSSNQTSHERVPESNEAAEPIQKSTSVYINNPDNEQLAAISIEEDEVYLQLTARELFGVQTKADKRKYYDGADVMQYAVKYSDDGFKLRDQQEQLLWKVKISETGVKLSSNEEMTSAYKISTSDQGKIKVKKDGEEVAALRFKEGKNLVRVGENYLLHGFDGSLAMGILLIEEIPEEQKFILCAELVRQGE